ncbi:hypothetical protein DL98DRAFT_633614 [Cadophora sp. DSE1049]|nr:hypothetical protein DL98DRAFT_633614 [Cadophora sp. DSE1049]
MSSATRLTGWKNEAPTGITSVVIAHTNMEASHFPAVHWAPHDSQLLSPEHIPGGAYKPILVSSPGGLSTPVSQSYFGPLHAAPSQWGDLLVTQPIISPQVPDPDFITLQSPVPFGERLPDSFLFQVNQVPDIWDCNFGDVENLGTASMSQSSTMTFMGTNNDYTNDHKLLMEDDPFPRSSRDHGYLAPGSDTICQECEVQFTTKASLNHHTKETQHTPYQCICKATFTRLDVLDRHIQVFSSDATIYCPYCQNTPKSFGRQDHLTQHLRGFHNMDIIADTNSVQQPRPPRRPKKRLYCSHDDCWDVEDPETLPSSSRLRRPSFQGQKQLTSHLREVHDECLFPCPVESCARKGRKGFFRNRDLQKHMRDHHSRSAH